MEWIIRTFFSLGYNMEMELVALEVDLKRAQDLGDMTILALLDLSEVFNTIEYGILLDQLHGLGVGSTVLHCSVQENITSLPSPI